MKPSKHIDEPAGRMVNNHGHWEYQYDDPALNPPLPPETAARPARKLRAVASTSSTCPDASLPGGADEPSAAGEPAPYPPVQLRYRHDGWTAERQRDFLTALAETGSISIACAQAGVSSRSAYRLRSHPNGAAFAQAWDIALKLATARLTALAYERATRGTVKETWVDGELKSTTRAPSDKLLMFLLQHLLPAGRPGDRWTGFEAMATDARASFPDQLAGLADQDIEMVELTMREFYDVTPGEQDDQA